MKPRKIYGQVEASKNIEREVLEPGAYVCKILNATTEDTQWGEKLILNFDIAEGDSAGYYKRKYDNRFNEDDKWKGNFRSNVPADDGSEQDNRTASRFKRTMQDIEESNPGFHWDWDEKKLIGKSVGILFGNKEYEYNGKSGFFPNPKYILTVEDVKNGKFKVPEDQLLDRSQSSPIIPSVKQASTDFMTIPESADGEGFPF